MRLAGLLRSCGHTLYHMGGGRSGQLRLLSMLDEREQVSQRELTERAGVQPGSMSEILAKMEQRGLIERAPLEGDRRAFSVRITDAGRQMLGELRAQNDEAASALFARLDSQEKAQLAELLGKLADSWRERADAREGAMRGRRRDGGCAEERE